MNIVGRDYEVTKGIRDYVEERLGFIQDFLSEGEEVDLVLSKDGPKKEIKIRFDYKGHPVNITEHNPDLYTGIDSLKDRVFNTIVKKKNIEIDKRRKETRALRGEKLSIEEDDGVEVIDKTLYLKPMVIEEAVLQMNLLGFSFFVFLNGEGVEDYGLQPSIIYREEGRYGLLLLKMDGEEDSDIEEMYVPGFIDKVKSVPLFKLSKVEAIQEMQDYQFPFYPYFDTEENREAVMYVNKRGEYCSRVVELD